MALSATDLLCLTDDQQQIVRCLIRQPEQSVEEISRATAISSATVESVVSELTAQRRLTQRRVNGQLVYSADLSIEPQRTRKPAANSGLFSIFDVA
jgi:DeoR/GlpR family transcriptional regulator of sugar metabolism